MNAFEIHGGKPLKGEITPQGAKNEALQIISAVLLTEEKMTISNVPDITDVNRLIDLLVSLGVTVERLNADTYQFEAKDIQIDYFQSEEFKQKGGSLRGSIMIVGPLLARFGQAAIPRPGGDKIGRRRLDTHFLGFEKLGAKFIYDAENVDAATNPDVFAIIKDVDNTRAAHLRALGGGVGIRHVVSLAHKLCDRAVQRAGHWGSKIRT